MKYFIDTEFLEGTQSTKWLILKGRLSNALIGTNKPTIDLISIGIVSEDNREYYAISKDFNLKEAWNRHDIRLPESMGDEPIRNYWIRDNVLKPIWNDWIKISDLNKCYEFNYKNFKKFLNIYGKTNKEIAEEIVKFVNKDSNLYDALQIPSIKFYGYYCDYDWVVFCWLYGKMIDLPKGFPKFCFDIQQIIVENNIDKNKLLKEIPQINSHNALSDCIWNKDCYNYIINQIKK